MIQPIETFWWTSLKLGWRLMMNCLKPKMTHGLTLCFFKEKLKIINKNYFYKSQRQLACTLICIMLHSKSHHFTLHFASEHIAICVKLSYSLRQVALWFDADCIAFCHKTWKKGKRVVTFPTAKIINFWGECKSCLNLIDKQSAAISIFIHNPYKIIQKSCFSVTPI